MNRDRSIQFTELDERTALAVRELQESIAARYPATIFELVRSPDDPEVLHLLAVADVEDPDEVGDLVVERVVALQVDEGIPLHVIPLRSRERVVEARASGRHGGRQRTIRLWNGV